MDSINKEFYNAFGNEFDKIPFGHILPQLIIKYLPSSKCKILEIGSGAGALAQWLSSLGCDVTCLEPAEKPAQSAREKGLNVHSVTLQDYQINQTFDLVIAISSLIHIPKQELPVQISRIASCLKPEGLFLASFLMGAGEGLEDPTGKGKTALFLEIHSGRSKWDPKFPFFYH